MGIQRAKMTKEGMLPGKKVSLLLFAIAFFVTAYGLFSYYYGKYSYRDKTESCTAVTEGSVDSCTKKVVYNSRRGGTTSRKTYFDIQYRYVVEGKTYSGMQRLTYQAGKTIQVHYTPDMPGKSFIGNNPPDTYENKLSFLVLAGWLIVLGVLIRIVRPVGVNKTRRKKSACSVRRKIWIRS